MGSQLLPLVVLVACMLANTQGKPQAENINANGVAVNLQRVDGTQIGASTKTISTIEGKPSKGVLLVLEGPKGPKGDKGDQGEPGAQGEPGDPGATVTHKVTGPAGEPGPQGEKGMTGLPG